MYSPANAIWLTIMRPFRFDFQIIKKKREMLRTGVDHNGDMFKDLLGKMVLLQDEQTGKTLSDEVIEAQVHTFMVAGHETTSVGLTWTFYLLAKHPDVQEKVVEENVNEIKLSFR